MFVDKRANKANELIIIMNDGENEFIIKMAKSKCNESSLNLKWMTWDWIILNKSINE